METPGRRFQYGDRPLYTDWFSRSGDGIVVRGQSVNYTTTNGLKVKIEVFTKKSTDSGDGAIVDSTWKLELDDDADVHEKILTSDDDEGDPGMYDLVRYKISVTGGATGEFIVARIFPPIFFDKSH